MKKILFLFAVLVCTNVFPQSDEEVIKTLYSTALTEGESYQ